MSVTGTKVTVHEAWANTMRDLAPVPKGGYNDAQRFKFRGIDQVMNALAGPMRTHGTFVIPEILDARYEASQDGRFTSARLTVRFTLYGPNGDSIAGSSQGEAKDTYDKATSKAMAMAFKYFLFYAGMIPLDASSIEDGERHSEPQPSPTPVRTQQHTVSTNFNPQDLANKAIEAFNKADDETLQQIYQSSTKAQLITSVQGMTGEMVVLKDLILGMHAELNRGREPA